MVFHKSETSLISSIGSSSSSSSSSCEDEESKNKGGAEEKKKVKKLRSIKLSKFQSLKKSSTRKPKSQSSLSSSMVSSSASSSISSSSDRSTPASNSHSSPNYMKPTTCSHTRNDPFQTTLIRRSSSKQMRTSSRMSSSKLRKPSTRKFSGGSEMKSKLKNFASIELQSERPLISPEKCQNVSNFDDGNSQFQESYYNSESGDRIDTAQKRNVTVLSKPKPISPASRSGMILSRKSSLKPLKKLTKMATFKSKKWSRSYVQDSRVERATCSSALKDSKFPDRIKLQAEETETEKIGKVCPYTYCSLQGLRHPDVPPLKRFVSMRRRVLKTQKSKKQESQSLHKSKNYRSRKEGTQRRKIASNIAAKTESSEEKNNDLELECGTGNKEREPAGSKYIRMWHLVYKDAVKGITAEVKNEQTLSGVEKDEEAKDADNFPGSHQNGSSCLGIFETNVQEATLEQGKPELCSDAVKMVQKAFDEILLPEIDDHSPHDPSNTSVIVSGEELSRKSRDEEDLVPDKASINSREEKEMETMVGNKSSQQVPKRWSNLKKLILLKRFVRALERVRNINTRKPRYLSNEADPETENVNLKHQTVEERKNSEEWMLDYALRQVISKLGPDEKRKVALLVEAFETVVPNPMAAVSSNLSRACTYSHEIAKECDCEHNGDSLLWKISHMKSICNESVEQCNDIVEVKHVGPVKISEGNEEIVKSCHLKPVLDEPVFEALNKKWKKEEIVTCSTKNEEENRFVSTGNQPEPFNICIPDLENCRLENKLSLNREGERAYQEVPVNGKVLKVSKVIISRLSNELHGGDSELDKKSTDMLISETSEQSDVYERSTPENHEKQTKIKSAMEEPTVAIEKIDTEKHVAVEHNNAANGVQLEKMKNTGLWYLIYKHMVSSIAAKEGSEPLSDGAEKEQADENDNTGPETNIPTGLDSPEKRDQHLIEATMLVKEAIDEILLPERDESPDDQSKEPKPDSSSKSASSLNPDDMSGREEQNIAVDLGGKRDVSTQKRWRNLKKLILLKRFIKAVEKVKKFNPRGPDFLPLVPDVDAEKVELRHQETGERKNAEEWMLDYALQQAVAKLSPARKRKVELLVEAFETIR